MLHNDLPLLPSQRGGGGVGAAALPKLSPVVIPVWWVLVCTRWRSRLWGEPGNSDDTDGSWQLPIHLGSQPPSRYRCGRVRYERLSLTTTTTTYDGGGGGGYVGMLARK